MTDAETGASKRRRLRSRRTMKPETGIYWWSVESDSLRKGVRAKYEVLLLAAGMLSCNCPGWVFHPGRECKHTKAKKIEAEHLHDMWKKGEELPARVRVTRAGGRETISGPYNEDVSVEIDEGASIDVPMPVSLLAPEMVPDKGTGERQLRASKVIRKVRPAKKDEPETDVYDRKIDL